MAYRVIHRPDGLLQANNSRDHEAEGLADTFIGRHTAPAHQALERFIDERLSGRTFDTLEDLRLALGEWQSFYYSMHKRAPHETWSRLYVGTNGRLYAATSGLGGNFVFALFEQVKADAAGEQPEAQLAHA